MCIYAKIGNFVLEVYKFEKSRNMPFQYSYIVGVHLFTLIWVNRWMDCPVDAEFSLEKIWGWKYIYIYHIYLVIYSMIWFFYCTKVYGMPGGFVLEKCDLGEVLCYFMSPNAKICGSNNVWDMSVVGSSFQKSLAPVSCWLAIFYKFLFNMIYMVWNLITDLVLHYILKMTTHTFYPIPGKMKGI